MRNLNRIYGRERTIYHQIFELTAAQLRQFLIVVEHRILIVQSSLRINLRVVRVHLQPRLDSRVREPTVRRVIPLHGGAGVIAALNVDSAHRILVAEPLMIHVHILVETNRIAVAVVVDRLEPHIGHAQFLTLINIGGSLHKM